MTEAVIDDVVEELHEETVAPDIAKAMDGGWKPQEEWEGDDNEWIDARTFNMRGDLMDRIKSQTSQLRGQDRKIQKLEGTMSQLAEHNRKMDEVAFKKALNELKGLKRDALDMSDHDQVIEIDEQISELKTYQKESAQQIQPDRDGDTNPEVAEWIDQNKWYVDNTTMRGAADALALEIVRTNPELRGRPSEVLEKVTMRLKEEFPSKFNARRQAPTVAEPGQADISNRSKTSRSKYSSRHLNEVQSEIGRTFVQDGIMKDLNEYASQLAELGELDAQKGA